MSYYKVSVEGEEIPLSPHLYELETIISYLQDRWGRISPQKRQLVRSFLARKGAPSYLFRVTPSAYVGSKKFFQELAEVFKGADQIWMCVGEVGHRLMDRDEIVNSLRQAAKNKASISVIHGPRTDPKTKRLFKLARFKRVTFHRLDYYPDHHFFLVKSKSGELTLIEESPHLEPVRVRTESGDSVEFYKSIHRIFYIIHNPRFLGKWRLHQAKNRIARSQRVAGGKFDEEPRGYPMMTILVRILLVIFPYSFVVQPLIIILDRALSPSTDFFKRLSRRAFVQAIIGLWAASILLIPAGSIFVSAGNAFGRVVEFVELRYDENNTNSLLSRKQHKMEAMGDTLAESKMSSHKETKPRSQDLSVLRKRIENWTVLTFSIGSSIVLAGILLEVVLRVPSSNLPAYATGGVSGAVVGAAFGNYLNTLFHSSR